MALLFCVAGNIMFNASVSFSKGIIFGRIIRSETHRYEFVLFFFLLFSDVFGLVILSSWKHNF